MSDDRGQVNEPRFYEFRIKKENKIWKLENGQVHFIQWPVGRSPQNIVDQEAIAKLPNGNFLISSEGDNNKKPRVPPRIFEITEVGKWVRDLPMPARVVPESTGQQKIGIGNNFGFEAMAASSDGNELFYLSERPLVQDIDSQNSKTYFRFYQMKYKSDHYEPWSEKLVNGPMSRQDRGMTVTQGFSEMISIGELTQYEVISKII